MDEIVLPDEKILGPEVIPEFIAFLKDIVTVSEPPKFLTVVNPANNVFFAFIVALIA